GVNEKLLSDFTRKHNVRDKCGFDIFKGGGRVTNSASYIKEYIEGTIERLGFAPDLYYLHRMDPVAKINAIQSEYSAFKTLHKTNGMINTYKELGVAYVTYSPLGHGVLIDNFQYKSPDDFAPDDFHRTYKDIILTEEEQAELRVIINKTKPHGNRFGPAHKAVIDH
ncbi:hypothetical protein EDB81DRAFT_793984, partial [Dactylonectria macrodidyma]